jgi:hypothetical protein
VQRQGVTRVLDTPKTLGEKHAFFVWRFCLGHFISRKLHL